MKKFSIFALTIAMVFTMVACGRSNDTQNDTPAQDTTTNNTDGDMMPDVLPDVDQNVPDPDVEGAMPESSTDTQNNADQGNHTQDGQSQNNDTQGPTDDNMGRNMK